MRVLFEFSGPVPEHVLGMNFKKRIIRRKSNGFELDVVTEDPAIIDAVSRSENCLLYRIVQEVPPFESPDFGKITETVRLALDLFRQERYWESHVVLETVWRNSEGDMKSFLRGLILVASSQVHYQMGHMETAWSMYEKGKDMVMKSSYSKYFGMVVPEYFSYPLLLHSDLL
ncbi:MAG: DUF309 domain-containing protein [Candidatus Thermoplasmatota archaeon]|nr:DUF309 domain-containing protein [Candidatus Thermoplasmatota archaeon]MCL5665464.1 DUF309 domain-containing protein [Candidatus Thermoplasmatota archaeon]